MRQGSVLLQQGRFEEALEKFEEADQLAPNNPTTYNTMGVCHLNLRQFDQALIYFNRCLDLVPTFTDARNNRGATYLSMGQYRMAEVDFATVLADNTYPHHYRVYYNLGMAQLKRRQLGAAEENLRKAVAAPVPVYEAFFELATLYAEQGKTDQAISLFEDAMLQYPERKEANLGLGRLLVQLGREQEGREILEELISSDPETAVAGQARAILGEL
jgi:tetratricopeptide (TPR) repeat protein